MFARWWHRVIAVLVLAAVVLQIIVAVREPGTRPTCGPACRWLAWRRAAL
jgi:hypothetical protein